METTLRERASDALLRSAVDRAVERTAIERRIALIPPSRPGYQAALNALTTARRMESVVLWLAWRLQPRNPVL